MARNAEKAQSMLFRFRESQAADLGITDIGRQRRPKVISEQTNVSNCERWRGQVLKEISRKVSKIQDAALSDFQVRDLNDEINKLMREKHMWEVQIRNLGGPNYTLRTGPGGKSNKEYDENGREIPGAGKGYRYYGRARELPGVKELFEAARAKAGGGRRDDKGGAGGGADAPLEERDDLRKDVDAAYYGYGPDEEDNTLLSYEAAREAEAHARLAAAADAGGKPPPGWEPLPGDIGDGKGGWLLPTVEEVQQELLERRKQRILDQLS
ncbi:NineTeen Complex (NTC) component [Sporothrix stenoceras]|uniref:NineTeen Complex (NTC) component n=1 Tax=Sporothrix stenoceras TaxID=5173 RepID=A0ABR3YI40_9PEZI